MPAVSEHFFQSADGLRLFYALHGNDRGDERALPVLCLPGLTRNSRDFESIADWLASGYRVITPDLRGRGRSQYDANWGNYRPDVYVADAFRVLDELRVTRCAIIGTSLGGLMAMVMAAAQSQRVAGIVINDIGPELDPRGVARIRSYAGKVPMVRSWPEAVAQSREVHGHAMPDFTDRQWQEFARRAYREHDDGTIRRDVDPNISRAFGEPQSSAPDLWPVFRQLMAVPTLVIRGGLSDLFSAATLARMQVMKPDLRALIVPNRGHAPTLDEPECRHAIGEFLAGLASRA